MWANFEGEVIILIDPEKSKRIWTAYSKYVETTFIVREGFQSWKMTQNYHDETFADISKMFYTRGQSCLEHQANTAFLACLFGSNYPSFFGAEYAKAMDNPWMWLITMTCLVHDIGDTKTGNIAKDGRVDPKSKREIRYDAFLDLILGLDIDDVSEIIAIANYFKYESDTAWAINAVTTLDAVLFLTYLEGRGLKGTIKHKDNQTVLDQKLISMAKTGNPVDCLAMQLKASFEKESYPDSITEPIYGVLKAAINEVRGKDFKWWDKPLKDLYKYI